MIVIGDNGKSWKTETHTDDNYWRLDGQLGPSTVWVKATSDSGSSVVVENVPVKSYAIKKGPKNYA